MRARWSGRAREDQHDVDGAVGRCDLWGSGGERGGDPVHVERMVLKISRGDGGQYGLAREGIFYEKARDIFGDLIGEIAPRVDRSAGDMDASTKTILMEDMSSCVQAVIFLVQEIRTTGAKTWRPSAAVFLSRRTISRNWCLAPPQTYTRPHGGPRPSLLLRKERHQRDGARAIPGFAVLRGFKAKAERRGRHHRRLLLACGNVSRQAWTMAAAN